MVIAQSINKNLKQVDFKIRCSVNISVSVGGSSDKSYITSHKCGKKGHIKENCRSKRNGSSGNPPKNYENELPEGVTKTPIV